MTDLRDVLEYASAGGLLPAPDGHEVRRGPWPGPAAILEEIQTHATKWGHEIKMWAGAGKIVARCRYCPTQWEDFTGTTTAPAQPSTS